MAFTNAQKVNIRFYLGYPQVYLQSNPRLESAIIVVGNDSDASTMVTDILASLVATNVNLTDVQDTVGLKRAEDIEWHAGMERMKSLRSEGRRYCSQLSALFGVPVASDVFGTSGYQGDSWKGSNGLSSGFNFNLGFK